MLSDIRSTVNINDTYEYSPKITVIMSRTSIPFFGNLSQVMLHKNLMSAL